MRENNDRNNLWTIRSEKFRIREMENYSEIGRCSSSIYLSSEMAADRKEVSKLSCLKLINCEQNHTKERKKDRVKDRKKTRKNFQKIIPKAY